LYCSDNQLTDLSPLRSLVNLRKLDCSRNPNIDILPLTKLPNFWSLYWLILGNDEKQLIIANYALLEKGIALDFKKHIFEQYHVEFRQGIETNALIEAPEPPQDLVTIMTQANFQGSSSYGYLDNLNLATPLVNLQELDCSCNQLTNLSPLRSLVNLQELDCSGSLFERGNITDLSPLRSLVNLRELDCGWNRLTDLSPLQSLLNLQELNCWNNRIPDSEIQTLQQYLPKCEIYS
jgi:internalin A